MGGILNGLAAHGGVIPFGATFLDLFRLHAAAASAWPP